MPVYGQVVHEFLSLLLLEVVQCRLVHRVFLVAGCAGTPIAQSLENLSVLVREFVVRKLRCELGEASVWRISRIGLCI